jgi:hypothetical protein
MARYLLPTHLLDAVIAVVNPEDFLTAQHGDTDDKDVFTDEHVAAVKLPSHGKLPPAHVRHQQHGFGHGQHPSATSIRKMTSHSPSTKASSSSGRRQTPPLSFWVSLWACLLRYCRKAGQKYRGLTPFRDLRWKRGCCRVDGSLYRESNDCEGTIGAWMFDCIDGDRAT